MSPRPTPMRSTARSHLVDYRSSADSTPDTPAESRPDFAALAGRSDAIVSERTGRDWAAWLNELDARGAARLPHRDIARLLMDEYDVPGWWAQTVTVGYERIKGLRAVNQRSGGRFGASRSKTFPVALDVLFALCADARRRARWWPNVKLDARPDGNPPTLLVKSSAGAPRTTLYFVSKGPQKCTLTVDGANLPDREAVDRFKEEWGTRLAALAGKVRAG